MLTNNSILVDNIRETRTIFCIQRNAEKRIPTEEILIASNISSFGDDIGKTTNKVTAMYDVQSQFEQGSKEYGILEYRIQAGQLFQQNAIDRIKGIICNPMPRKWFDYHTNALPENATDEEIVERDFNLSIIADRKPYFMRYIYPSLMKQYKTYMKNVETKCAREFRLGLDELLALPDEEHTDAQREFIRYYERRLPISTGNCVMNRICRRFEEEFDGKMKAWCEDPFDYSIMKSGADYPRAKFERIKAVYDEHNHWMREYTKLSKEQRIDNEDGADGMGQRWFKQKCFEICSNGYELCDIVLDMCYKRSGTKEFAWDMSAYYIISNLARRHNGMISFPMLDPDGEIEFGGDRFSMATADWTYIDTEADLFDGDRTEREGLGDEGD